MPTRVPSRVHRPRAGSGQLALREMLEASGPCDFLSWHVTGHRNPSHVLHQLSEMLRAVIIQRGQGWIDLADTDVLREDPAFALACSDDRGAAPLDRARASQPTLSRLLAQLGRAGNVGVLQEGLMRITEWRRRSERCGQRPRTLMLDEDGVLIDVHGQYGRIRLGTTGCSPRLTLGAARSRARCAKPSRRSRASTP